MQMYKNFLKFMILIFLIFTSIYFVVFSLFGSLQQFSFIDFFDSSKEIVLNFDSIPSKHDFITTGYVFNSKGEIFVCNYKEGRLLHFNVTGSYIGQIKYSSGSRPPSAIAIDFEDNLWIVQDNAILIYHREGTIVRQFKVPFIVNSVAFDLEGNYYLIGFKDGHSIHKYNRHGQLLRSFGEVFDHNDPYIQNLFSGGSIVIIDRHLYFSQYHTYVIAVYNLEGELIKQFRRPNIDVWPKFEIKGTAYSFRKSSSMGSIDYVDGLILNTFYLLGKGTYLDILDIENNVIWTNLPIQGYILGSDKENNIYYMSDKSRSSIFKGRSISKESLPLEKRTTFKWDSY